MSIDVKAVRAFEYPQYDYYRLTRDLGPLKEGTIFFHDPDDHIYGSVAAGCLKNCWTTDGNCFPGNDFGVCGGTVILHYSFANSDLFEKVERNEDTLMSSLSPGHYEMDVHANGRWELKKHGGMRL